ncbi:flagellar biosynthesis regulator FlaF [Propylenella binzhouense]|uniref:Flagellar biosynthesis regulator FlaF n=1 Tax=Propylenella binzhouense TaxID=2555902 RepID=A0A964T3P3_9HYPH|nr:flagellar biosynthesis regulator FlaF [Propylenella binzhouense]MYZ46962.1 flagellar biosynthesis regulator FlaF [Propylenella binzhouense]
MYQSAYAEVLDERPQTMRDSEREAFDRSIALLEAAERAGPGTREAAESLHFLIRLWSILLDDLASPGNSLAPDLRAGLISIGIWIVKEADRIRLEEADSFVPLIEISRTIRDGLKGQNS